MQLDFKISSFSSEIIIRTPFAKFKSSKSLQDDRFTQVIITTAARAAGRSLVSAGRKTQCYQTQNDWGAAVPKRAGQ